MPKFTIHITKHDNHLIKNHKNKKVYVVLKEGFKLIKPKQQTKPREVQWLGFNLPVIETLEKETLAEVLEKIKAHHPES